MNAFSGLSKRLAFCSFAALSLLCGSHWPVQAQQSLHDTEQWLVLQALQHNLSLQAQHHLQQQTHLAQQALRQRYLPRLEADALYGYFHTQIEADAPTRYLPLADALPEALMPIGLGMGIPAGTNLFEGASHFTTYGHAATAGLTAKILLFSGRQIPLASKTLVHKDKAERYALAAAEQALAEELLQHYEQLLLLHKSRVLLDESRKRLEKEQLRVQKAITQGLATPYERNKIEAALLQLESKEKTYEHQLSLLSQKISLLSGLPEAQIPIDTAQIAPLWASPFEIQLENRAEWQALEAQQEAYQAKVRMAKNFYLPKIQAFASYRYLGVFGQGLHTEAMLPGGQQAPISLHLDKLQARPALLVGIGLKWTLFDGLEEKHRIESAKINQESQALERQYKQQQLTLAYEKAWREHSLAQQLLTLKAKELDISQHNYLTASESYRIGLLSVSEWLTSEQEYQQASLAYQQAVIQQRAAARSYWRAAGYDLQQAFDF
ncbi:TolC family protein [Eisenibacter elegans]|jgi:outer membrane protein TolC|uniref:TolC family protein n=1 Tax=Eisenibacter elegans TaxID=997 RepID=UPI00047B5F45|nr:TolC family protein [Eisenibacter elegans]